MESSLEFLITAKYRYWKSMALVCSAIVTMILLLPGCVSIRRQELSRSGPRFDQIIGWHNKYLRVLDPKLHPEEINILLVKETMTNWRIGMFHEKEFLVNNEKQGYSLRLNMNGELLRYDKYPESAFDEEMKSGEIKLEDILNRVNMVISQIYGRYSYSGVSRETLYHAGKQINETPRRANFKINFFDITAPRYLVDSYKKPPKKYLRVKYNANRDTIEQIYLDDADFRYSW